MPRAGLGGDVVCGRRARIAPRRACRGCRLREKGKNCPAQSLSGMSFAGEIQSPVRFAGSGESDPGELYLIFRMSFVRREQELPRSELAGDVVCGRRTRIAPGET